MTSVAVTAADVLPAVHQAILVIDVERFGDHSRTDAHRVAIRDALYELLGRSFGCAGVRWERCWRQDTGDGALILVPATVPKALLAGALLSVLTEELKKYNAACDSRARIRVRVVLHAGEVRRDGHGAVGEAINLAFRLAESPALRQALAGSPDDLALMTSEWFYSQVIRNEPGSDPAAFELVPVSVKETRTTAWVRCVRPSVPPVAVHGGDTWDLIVPRQFLAARDSAGYPAGRARIVTFDPLTPDQAVRKLISDIRGHRKPEEPRTVSEIAALCSYLPLALSVVAARTIEHPGYPLAVMAAELRDAADGTGSSGTGAPWARVQAVFGWSSQLLSPGAARTFRLAGLHPGPTLSVPVAAALADVHWSEAGRQLRELAHARLLAETGPGLYTLHGLLRDYAVRQASVIDGEQGITAAHQRLLHHYARGIRAASVHLYPWLHTTACAHADQSEYGLFDSARQAWIWLTAERSNLIAAVPLAAELGSDPHAWQFLWHLTRSGYWD